MEGVIVHVGGSCSVAIWHLKEHVRAESNPSPWLKSHLSRAPVLLTSQCECLCKENLEKGLFQSIHFYTFVIWHAWINLILRHWYGEEYIIYCSSMNQFIFFLLLLTSVGRFERCCVSYTQHKHICHSLIGICIQCSALYDKITKNMPMLACLLLHFPHSFL